eukprot:128861-Pleurochrysis_carterae.AAC.1
MGGSAAVSARARVRARIQKSGEGALTVGDRDLRRTHVRFSLFAASRHEQMAATRRTGAGTGRKHRRLVAGMRRAGNS